MRVPPRTSGRPFRVNDKKAIYECVGCSAHEDCIDFAQHAYKLTFRQAVNALASEQGLSNLDAQIDPIVLKRNEERRRKNETERARYRAAAQRIWSETLPIENSPAERYLRSRAITGLLPATLRYHPELGYEISEKTWIVLPAMVGQIVRFDMDPDNDRRAPHLPQARRLRQG